MFHLSVSQSPARNTLVRKFNQQIRRTTKLSRFFLLRKFYSSAKFESAPRTQNGSTIKCRPPKTSDFVINFFFITGQKSLKHHNICIILCLGFMVICRQFWKNYLRASLFDIFARLWCKIRREATEYTRTQLEGIKYLLAAKPFRIKCSVVTVGRTKIPSLPQIDCMTHVQSTSNKGKQLSTYQ